MLAVYQVLALKAGTDNVLEGKKRVSFFQCISGKGGELCCHLFIQRHLGQLRNSWDSTICTVTITVAQSAATASTASFVALYKGGTRAAAPFPHPTLSYVISARLIQRPLEKLSLTSGS